MRSPTRTFPKETPMPPHSPLRRRLATGLALSPLAGALPTFAQGTLPKSISFVVPNAAGGSNDVMARAVAARLPALLGSSVVVENKPGAGGNLGSAWVAKSAPKDGSTWLVTVNSAQTINPALYKNTGFDPINDFEPVAGIAVVQHALLATPGLPANNLAELTALAKKDPGRYSFGSAGNGSFAHLLMEVFKKQQGVNLTHVPYKGVAPALTDLIAGNLHILVSTIPACIQFIKSGQVKVLAVPSEHPSPALPNVPLARQTVPGLSGDLWVAVYAPKGVAREHIEQMRNAVAKVVTSPEMDTFFAAQGASPLKAGPTELLAMTKEELAKWGPIVRESGMRVD
jgi:tripartite-type tricarboxylate transporter receptor subunit TctC